MRNVPARSVGLTTSENLADIALDSSFSEENVESGLTSGAGLIWRIRDPQERKKQIDSGVDDKRLLVVEPEFGGVLRVCQRKENDLSAVIRDSWDGKTLRTLAKQEPAKATCPHVCIIGHVTREELRATLSKIDSANGFSNRILWYCSRRSKLLPDGGELHLRDMQNLTQRIRHAVEWAQVRRRLTRSSEASELWHHVYGQLTAPRPGVFGLATTRAEAQTLRLSMLYAILDEAEVIDIPHLQAALAVWKYSEASAHWAFGASLGNPVADELLAALRQVAPRGLSSTDIQGLFNRNRRASEIRSALGVLQRYGLARSESCGRLGPGRPALIWYAI